MVKTLLINNTSRMTNSANFVVPYRVIVRHFRCGKPPRPAWVSIGPVAGGIRSPLKAVFCVFQDMLDHDKGQKSEILGRRRHRISSIFSSGLFVFCPGFLAYIVQKIAQFPYGEIA